MDNPALVFLIVFAVFVLGLAAILVAFLKRTQEARRRRGRYSPRDLWVLQGAIAALLLAFILAVEFLGPAG